MTIEVRVPQLPESVADATLVSWHKKPGDSVVRDENLVDLETDKVVLEVPAPTAGVLKEIKLTDGTTVTSGQVLAIIEEGAASIPGASAPAIMAAPSGAIAEAQDTVKDAAKSEAAGGKLSPAAKRVAEENKVDPKTVSGSGRDGRVSKSDVVNYLSAKDSAAPAAATPGPAAATPGPAAVTPGPVAKAPAQFVPAPSARGARAEQRVPMTRLRARIAERMVQAQATQALLTSFNEVDLKTVNELRARYKDQFEKQFGVKLGFMSFFTKACVEALKKFPAVNASVDGNDIVYHEYFDVGVAVSTDRGLIVPVLRDADQLSFADIEKSIANFAARARAGSITIEELTGGTFTITNGGVFGSLLSTPIVNAPQSAILGMHKIQDRPVAVDGQVVVRPMMYIALTYDHRIIDGREAVQFLVTVKQCLEDPARMVLHI
ncbi:MAG TPA: 2-oxoglutarate dehydrogenase complex dihydrolipoyllysine-residue succinyltransferase [Steroidobacteraceae bacterium]|jgi:2-oxoglutarate dehydrogenase E2 component (dihydrolipoamide succinyltransferase)|nr:2-oxoglutarate dehydrogenase complex dihydrolipoyllysine-residue succinyltransferase [Steroidobacteraceae bacterium]